MSFEEPEEKEGTDINEGLDELEERVDQELAEEEEEESKEREDEVETIYVGSKPLMRYVMAAMRIFLDENPQKMEIAARGRAISRAVDTAEVLRRRYLKGIVDVEDVLINTDEVKNERTGEIDRVSSMTITLKKLKELPMEKKREIAERM